MNTWLAVIVGIVLSGSIITLICIVIFSDSGLRLSDEDHDYDYPSEEDEIKEFGDYGEDYVQEAFEDALFGLDYNIINNFKINANGKRMEIDLVIITKGGLFIIETKSYKGRLVELDDGRFELIKKDYQEDKIIKYNPSEQNERHIRLLKSVMGNDAPPMISMIVFPFADITEIEDDRWFELDDAIDYVLYKTRKGSYSNDFIERVYNKLQTIEYNYHDD